MHNAAILKTRVALAEYLELEHASESKHEWLDGVVYAMAGGTPEHGILAMRVGHLLQSLIGERPSVVTSSDVRVRVEATGLVTYPDLAVVCGPIERSAADPLAVVNPLVLVEVLSERTEAYDRGEKFAHYRRIPALREYVLVAQDEPRMEVFRRTERGRWELAEAVAGERVPITALGGELAVDAVFRGVELSSARG